jgi:hypothetical protein
MYSNVCNILKCGVLHLIEETDLKETFMVVPEIGLNPFQLHFMETKAMELFSRSMFPAPYRRVSPYPPYIPS